MCLVTGCPDKGIVLGTRSRKCGRGDFCVKHSVQDDIKPDKNAHFDLSSLTINNNNNGDVKDSYKIEKFEEEDIKKGQIPKLKLKLDAYNVTKTDDDSDDPLAVGTNKKTEKKRQNKQSSERRKEKSRDAARYRRSKESELYTALSECLPLPQEVLANLDKASIMRLAIAYLNTGNMVNAALSQHKSLSSVSPAAQSPPTKDNLMVSCPHSGDIFQDILLQAIDGFLLVLSSSGRVDFVSPSVASHLGLPQVDIIGVPLSDLVHQCDHEDLRHLLQVPANSGSSKKSNSKEKKSNGTTKKGGRRTSNSRKSSKTSTEGEDEEEGVQCFEPRHGFLRMKCTLASRGRNVTIRNASYKVVEICGKMVYSSRSTSSPGSPSVGWLICIAAPVPHPANIEVPLDSQTYFSKHSLDMKFTYADENFPQFCGFTPDELEGKSLFQLHHELDGPQLRSCFHTLRVKGQVSTGQYRFLASGGGYVWLVTQATVIHSSARDSAPSAVVCLHYVISGVQCSHEIVSCIQLTDQDTSSDRSLSKTCGGVYGGGGASGGSGTAISKNASSCGQRSAASSSSHRGMLPLSATSSHNSVSETKNRSQSAGADDGGFTGLTPANLLKTSILTERSSLESPQTSDYIGIDRATPEDTQAFHPSDNTSHLLSDDLSGDVKHPQLFIPSSLNLDSTFVLASANECPPTFEDDIKATETATAAPKNNTCDVTCDGGYDGGSWCLSNKNTATAPLLTQAAADISPRPNQLSVEETEDDKDPSSFTSSTAELFTSLDCPIDESADPLCIEDFLFSSEPNDISVTSELFAEDNFLDLKASQSADTQTAMDVISGTNLFKSEPFYEVEDFDGRAPFLPFSVDENVIMWSPSLEFETTEEDAGHDYSSDTSSYNSNKSSASPGSACSNSPKSVASPNTNPNDASFYLPDGSLNISALRESNTNGRNKVNSPQCSLLEELLLEGSGVKTPSIVSEGNVQHQSCIDPNSVWPGHNKIQSCDPLSILPQPDFICKDEILELDKLIPDLEMPVGSLTLAPASMETPQYQTPASPLSQYTMSPAPYSLSPAPQSISPSPYATNAQTSTLSPALASFDPFSARSPSASSLSSRHSSPVCSPRHPDITVINCNATKRSLSPISSPQIQRKRLCSPHVDGRRSPCVEYNQQSSPGPSKGSSGGRKLQKPHAPYMQQLLIPRKSEPNQPSLSNQKERQIASGASSVNMQQVMGSGGGTSSAKTVLVTRSQVTGSNGNLYRLVEKPIAYRAKSCGNRVMRGTQIVGKDGGRAFFVRDKRSFPGTYIARNVKPLRLVTEKNVMEYVIPSTKVEDDNFEWVEVVEANGQNESAATTGHRQYIDCDRSFEGSSLISSGGDFNRISSPVFDTETTKCLLLPQNEYSAGNFFRLTESDYEVNAPARGNLLTGQDLLDALE